jgi:hypothetical protein
MEPRTLVVKAPLCKSREADTGTADVRDGSNRRRPNDRLGRVLRLAEVAAALAVLSLGPPGDIADDGGRCRRLENRRNAADAEMRMFVNAFTAQWMLQDYAPYAPSYVRTLIPPTGVPFALGQI